MAGSVILPVRQPGPESARGEMIRRVLREGPIGMTLAARLIGKFRDGKPTHVSTIGRWILHGVPRDGGVLRLEGFRLNGRLVTSEAAIVRFIEAQQVEERPAPTEPAVRASTARDRDNAAAARKLAAERI